MFSFFSKNNPPPFRPPSPGLVEEKASDHSWFTNLKSGLAKTRAALNTDVADLFARRPAIDDRLFEELETALIAADVGVRATTHLIDGLKCVQREKKITNGAVLLAEFKSALTDIIAPLEQALVVANAKPFVIMIAGVNGVGKTTTIGKLAKYLQSQGLTVMLAAGDTFRAAAREQLMTWGARNDVTVIAQESGESAAVIFDAINAAKARGIDVVLADTAGRLPTQLHLMEEIRKVKRVIAKADASAPHEILLVLDANTGQNGLAQVKAFDEALQLTGLVVTKLDGTAKGGMIAALAAERPERPIPVRFIGVGESIDDLRPFVATEFVDALF